MRRFLVPRVLFAAPLLCALALPAVADPTGSNSFGNFLNRKHVTLQRQLPPVLDERGKTVGVGVVRTGASGNVPLELQSAIESLLTRQGSEVQVKANSPDVTIACQVSEYSQPRITATTQNKVTTQTVTGALSVAFQITEVASHHVLASGLASWQISKDVGSSGMVFKPFGRQTGGPDVNSTMDAENTMVANVARQIAGYVVTTNESVEALLAVGKSLNGPDKLAANSLWSRDLEDLETLGNYSEPSSEAYLQYNIGVANEALAYKAESATAAVKYLEEASIDYGKAIDDKPDEKYFLEPQNRIKTALVHYTYTAHQQQQQLNPQPAPPQPPPSQPPPSQPEPQQTQTAKSGLSDDDIIAMVNAHIDETNVLDTIRTAEKVNFDLGVNGQIKLSKAGVNGRILLAMKKRARGSRSGAQ